MKMMRSLLPSTDNHRKGRNSTPSVATAPDYVISSLPLGSTDGTGQRVQGVILGIDGQTQAQQVADYTGVLQYLAPRCYGIRGSNVVTNVYLNSEFQNGVSDLGTTLGVTIGPMPGFVNGAYFSPGAANKYFHLWGLQGAVAPLANSVIVVSVFVKMDDDSVPNPSSGVTAVGKDFHISVGANYMTLINVESFDTENSIYRCNFSYLGQVGIYNHFLQTRADGTGKGFTVSGKMMMNMSQPKLALPMPYIKTDTATSTVCYDHLADGTPLRPFYNFSGTHRYEIFRPTELARSRVFNVGDCIEAVASDGIRYYYQCSVAGTTSATSPTFTPVGGGNVTDGGVSWTPAGYATIMGLELAPVGNANHPEGVMLNLINANARDNNQIMCYDFFPDTSAVVQAMSTNSQVYSGWTVDHMQSYVGSQQRASTGGKLPGRFTRSLIRMNSTNHILYNDGAMFTGASGGAYPANLIYIGAAQIAFQQPVCILNWCILDNAGLNDIQATARSNFDLKPGVAALFDGGPQLTQV